MQSHGGPDWSALRANPYFITAVINVFLPRPTRDLCTLTKLPGNILLVYVLSDLPHHTTMYLAIVDSRKQEDVFQFNNTLAANLICTPRMAWMRAPLHS